MFLSFFLIFIFLLMALLQIYFIGKLFSITQSTFVNQQSTILASGFLLYMFFTFLSLMPLYFFDVPQSFIYATLIIKDIFIILFLISRRDLFQKQKINFIEYGIIFLVSALIVISFRYLYHYVNKNVITANQNSNNYFLLNKIINFIKMITLSDHQTAILHFYMWPLLAVGIVSFTTSFYSMFIKKNNYLLYIIAFATTLTIIFLFRFNVSLEIWFAFFLLLFLFQLGMYTIIYSRRRYLALFTLGTISVWTLNHYLSLAIFALTLCLILAYIILKRPRPSFFIFQLIFPLLLIFSFWLKDYSVIGAIILASFVALAYASLFYFTRFNIIENNFLIRNLNYILPILIFMTFFLYAIVKISTWKNLNLNFLSENIAFFDNFKSEDFNLVINIFYYSIFFATVIYSMYAFFISKKRIIGAPLALFISSLIFIFFYNPLAFETLVSLNVSKVYIDRLIMASIVPVTIVWFSILIKKIINLASFFWILKTRN